MSQRPRKAAAKGQAQLGLLNDADISGFQYLKAFFSTFGRECYRTWRTDLLSSVVVAVAQYLLGSSPRDLQKLEDSAWILGAALVFFALFHLFRTVLLLQRHGIVETRIRDGSVGMLAVITIFTVVFHFAKHTFRSEEIGKTSIQSSGALSPNGRATDSSSKGDTAHQVSPAFMPQIDQAKEFSIVSKLERQYKPDPKRPKLTEADWINEQLETQGHSFRVMYERRPIHQSATTAPPCPNGKLEISDVSGVEVENGVSLSPNDPCVAVRNVNVIKAKNGVVVQPQNNSSVTR